MKSAKPNDTIALCVPAYNAARYLPRLFASVRQQTSPFDELWVYDDASSDGTAEVARGLGASVMRGETNKGCSFGKNRLAQATRCQWIHFHDADDALLPGFVGRARHWMRSDDVDVVLFGYEERDDVTGEPLGVRRFDDTDLRRDPLSYAIRNQINPFCGLYRRSAFLAAGGYDLDPLVLFNEDVAFHCKLAHAGLRFAADDNVLITNYRRPHSMSAANPSACLAAHYHVMRKLAESGGERYAKEIAHRLWAVAGGSAAYLDWQTADAAACLALRLGGIRQIPNAGLFKTLCAIDPRLAIRSRELLIRLLKPKYREGYPGWGQGTRTAGLDESGPR